MQLRNTVIMALVFVALATFVYFYEVRGRAERDAREAEAAKLLVFDRESVTEFTLATTDGDVTAALVDDEWSIVEPQALDADADTIADLLDDLAGADHDRLVAEDAEDLAPYGLDDPVVRIRIVQADGTERALEIGKDTPIGANVYVRRADETSVYTAGVGIRISLDKNLFDLRDRSILTVGEAEVERVRIGTANLTIGLRRASADEDRWELTAPTPGRADFDTIDDMLSTLEFEEAEAFVVEEPTSEQLAEHGLETPWLTLALSTADEVTHTLAFGSASGDPAGFFARRGSGPVIVVASEVLDDIPTSLEVLRNRAVLDVARETVNVVQLEGLDGPVRLEKAGADWGLTEPRHLDADASAMSLLLSNLIGLRAEGFATADDGLADPDFSASVGYAPEGEDARTVGFRVGSSTREIMPLSGRGEEDVEAVTVRAVAVDGDPTVYLVPDEDLGDLRVDSFDLRAKTLVQFTQEDLTALTFEAGDETWELVRDGEAWRVTSPRDLRIEGEEIGDFLWDLNYLRMEAVAAEWEDGDVGDLGPWGLDSPRYHIVARSGDSVLGDLAIGSAVSASGIEGAEESAVEGRVYARVEGWAGVYQVGDGVAASAEVLALILGDGSS